MGAAEESETRATREGLSPTLGDVLYAKPSRQPPSEEEWVGLVRAVARGEQSALHALYDRSHRLVFTITMRITSNRETAEELTLDVYHDVWRRAAQYDPANGTVLGWIMNQARSRAIDRLRFESRKKRVDPHPDAALLTIDTPDFRDLLEARDRSRALRSALTVLSTDEREAIESAYFLELTHVEIAARLQQPLGTIKTRIRAALHRLRQALAAEATQL